MAVRGNFVNWSENVRSEHRNRVGIDSATGAAKRGVAQPAVPAPTSQESQPRFQAPRPVISPHADPPICRHANSILFAIRHFQYGHRESRKQYIINQILMIYRLTIATRKSCKPITAVTAAPPLAGSRVRRNSARTSREIDDRPLKRLTDPRCPIHPSHQVPRRAVPDGAGGRKSGAR